MIRDYLYKISKLIYNNQITNNHITNANIRAQNKDELQQIIKTNDVILQRLKTGNLRPIQNQTAGDINAELLKLVDLEQKNIDFVNTNIKEIVDIAVLLVKFLGDMYIETNDPALMKLQDQVTDIVTSLQQYLAP